MGHTVKSDRLISTLQKELLEAKQTARHWELLATTDDLTGLHNRRMLHNVDQKISERRDGSKTTELTLLFIDLDDFGKLNKKFGDDVGDEALRLLGKTIRKNIRESDIAIRKGGDEFVIILMGSTPEMASATVVKRLQLMLDGELSLKVGDTDIPIRGSIGVFAYDQNITPFENLKQADELMRTQKQARKATLIPQNVPHISLITTPRQSL
ncbi:MAG: GGDEF domain-containing protein [Alphaproteobacteria bacterium]|nr:GGDEF domain-containing protein [Alphaproteobacteria bacterium]